MQVIMYFVDWPSFFYVNLSYQITSSNIRCIKFVIRRMYYNSLTGHNCHLFIKLRVLKLKRGHTKRTKISQVCSFKNVTRHQCAVYGYDQDRRSPLSAHEHEIVANAIN